MTISLGITGRTVFMSLEDYLRMSDDDFLQMTAFEEGFIVNHPFAESCLIDLTGAKVDDLDEEVEPCDDSLFSESEITEMLSNDSFGAA